MSENKQVELAIDIVDDIEQITHDLKTKMKMIEERAIDIRDLIEKRPGDHTQRVHFLDQILKNLESCEGPIDRADRASGEVHSSYFDKIS
jgi:hypothetical protein